MTASPTMYDFEVAASQVADRPPEERGLARDEVRLLAVTEHFETAARFADLADFLDPGDLVVVNDSRTMPAALVAQRGVEAVGLHLSTRLDEDYWVVEMRLTNGTGPILDGRQGEVLDLPEGASVELVNPAQPGNSRLWRARLHLPEPVDSYLNAHGRPIRYSYVNGRWSLDHYQTVFGRQTRLGFGSAEMPSAGRPFSRRVLNALMRKGVDVTTVTLHTGVSSPEVHEDPQPEWYAVSRATARAVRRTRRRGGRVVAIGTTVTRALESSVDEHGTVRASSGWTELVLSAEAPAQVVDGLVTGWHPAEASHLRLLESVADPSLVHRAYERALLDGFLWHEFGDACLLLPERRKNRRHRRRWLDTLRVRTSKKGEAHRALDSTSQRHLAERSCQRRAPYDLTSSL